MSRSWNVMLHLQKTGKGASCFESNIYLDVSVKYIWLGPQFTRRKSGMEAHRKILHYSYRWRLFVNHDLEKILERSKYENSFFNFPLAVFVIAKGPKGTLIYSLPFLSSQVLILKVLNNLNRNKESSKRR